MSSWLILVLYITELKHVIYVNRQKCSLGSQTLPVIRDNTDDVNSYKNFSSAADASSSMLGTKFLRNCQACQVKLRDLFLGVKSIILWKKIRQIM